MVRLNFCSLSDACDPRWRLSRDGLIIAGFVVSIVVLILAIILLIIAFYLHKMHMEDVPISKQCSPTEQVCCFELSSYCLASIQMV